MAFEINKKLLALKPYDPVEGEYQIRLDANESFIDYPDELIEKLSHEIKNIDFKRYPDPYTKDLIKSFCQVYDIDTENVVAGNGSDELIGLIIGSFLEKGDKIAVLSYDFSMYKFYASLFDNEVVIIDKNDDLTIDVKKTINVVNKKECRMLIFSNPCNPTSLGLNKDDVREIISKSNCLVVLDEAYMDFWDESLLSEINNYNNCIILKTCSKAVALAAARVGFAVSNKIITNCLKAAKSPYNVNSISQVASKMVLDNKSLISQNIIEIKEQTSLLYNELKKLQSGKTDIITVFKPTTNFVFLKVNNSDYIFEQLRKCSIIIRNFGGYLRITAGSAEENKILLNALNNIMK